MNLGDLIKEQGITILEDPESVRHYHKTIFIPHWYSKSFNSFDSQVTSMASPKKPFKATDYFKIKAGYPHEVNAENKEKITEYGCVRDKVSNKHNITIPKMNLQKYILFKNNMVSLTAPHDKEFVRDITIYDDVSDDILVFLYVVNRKAQVITAWSEPKVKGKYFPKVSKNIFKTMKYQKE